MNEASQDAEPPPPAVPAQAGTQNGQEDEIWISAFAGMSGGAAHINQSALAEKK